MISLCRFITLAMPAARRREPVPAPSHQRPARFRLPALCPVKIKQVFVRCSGCLRSLPGTKLERERTQKTCVAVVGSSLGGTLLLCFPVRHSHTNPGLFNSRMPSKRSGSDGKGRVSGLAGFLSSGAGGGSGGGSCSCCAGKAACLAAPYHGCIC